MEKSCVGPFNASIRLHVDQPLRHLKTRTTNHNAGGAHQTGSEASLYRPLYTSPGHLVA